MQHFLINSTACLFVLWLFYKLVLENTSWHQFKRYYLITALLFSITIPLVVIETIIIPVETQVIPSFNASNSLMIPAITTESTFEIDWLLTLYVIYSLGVVMMLWRFIKNIKSFKTQEGDDIQQYGKYQLILRHIFTVPQSFLNRIFVSKKEYNTNKIPHVVMEHERAHLDQKHSLDIIFIEVLLILFWFNPLLYLLKYAVKLNHEFLADKAVINKGISTTDYQELLLHYAQQSRVMGLTNTFNFPVIKKRFTIMTTQTPIISFIFRSLVLIPVVVLLIISCGKKEKKYELSEPEQVETKQVEITDIEYKESPKNLNTAPQEIVYAEPGEVITPDIYYKGVEFIVYDNAIRYNDTTVGDMIIKKLYEDLTDSDKENIGAFAFTVFNKPHTIRIPTESDMEEYQNPKVFRIWIDGEEVPNSKLKEYNISDFKSHSGRLFVHKTGRKVHPQAFNVMFYTPSYYKSKNMDKQQKYYGGKTLVTHKNVKRVRENYKDVINNKTQNNKLVKAKTTIISTDNLNKVKDTTNAFSYYVEVPNEPESKDFESRKQMLIASLKQNKTLNYQLNGKTATVTEIQDYLVNNETANVAFVEGAENTLIFSNNTKDSKMNMKELQDVYTSIFKYRPKEKSGVTVMAINETKWKVVTIDATVAKGSFTRKDSNYTYDASDLKNIKVFNEKGNQISPQKRKDLQLGFNPVWINGEEKLKELLADSKIIEAFKADEMALFHDGGYTKKYSEALKVNAKNTFLWIDNSSKNMRIVLNPHAWAETNPNYHQFKNLVKK